MTNSELNSIFKKISSLVALSSVLTFSPFKGMAVSSKLLAPPSHDKKSFQENLKAVDVPSEDIACLTEGYEIDDKPAGIQKTEDAIQEIEPVLPPTHDINSFKINLQAVDVPSSDIPHLINGYNDFLVAQKTLTSLWAFSQKNNINLNVNCLTAEVDQNGNIAMTLFDKDNPFTEENEENRQEYYCCDAQGNKLENNPHWKNIFNNRNPHICYYRDGNVYINIPCLPERKSTSTTATALKEKKDFVSFFKTQINGDCEYEYRHRDGSEEGLTMKDKIKGEKSYPIWEDNCGGYVDYRHQGGSKPQYQKAPELIQKQKTKSLISNSSRVRD